MSWNLWLAFVHLFAARWFLALPRIDPDLDMVSMTGVFVMLGTCAALSLFYFCRFLIGVWRYLRFSATAENIAK